MSGPIFQHLCGIACCIEYKYQHQELVKRELYFLKDHGFIRMKKGFERIEFDENLKGKNLVKIAEVTESGWSIIRMKAKNSPEIILKCKENLRSNLPDDIERMVL
jgi:hypothetical protein